MRAALLLLLALPARAAEVPETVAASYQAFLEGRYEDSEKGFKYLATLGIASPNPDSNLGVLARDRGDNTAALPNWVKASLLAEADGFLWNQRGWSTLSAGRPRQARQAFEKAIDRSSTTATQAEANLGLALAFLMESRPKGARAPLRQAALQGPYTLSAAYYLAALTAQMMGDKSGALLYFRQSLESDPLNLEALDGLARLYDKVGENRSAWRLYHRLLGLDPAESWSAERIRKLAKFITGDPETSLPIRRLGRPLLEAAKEPPAPKADTVRVLLYADARGRPAAARRLYFMTNAPFKLVAATGETIREEARPFEQWEISLRSDAAVVEVRDGARNIQYTAKQPFRVEPAGPGGTVLIKSARFESSTGFDPGDREVRGVLEAIPAPDGVRLVNELNLEHYLYGAVSAALPPGTPADAYKAMAVVARTNAVWHKAQGLPNIERSDLCDSPACQRYVGVNEEMRAATQAVKDTEGFVLTLDGRVARVASHENCGGQTEAGLESGEKSLAHLPSVNDAPVPAIPPRTPAHLERFVHEYPSASVFCEAGNDPGTRSRWVRVLDAKALRARAERQRPVGSVRKLTVLKRSPTGRVRALEVEGVEGKVTAEGFAAIEALLSPGTLRSNYFTVQPVLDGGKADHFILWGAGHGHGHGMCLAGASGQAALGRNLEDILKVYFPHMKVEHLTKKPQKPAAKDIRPRSGYRKPKNPKFKKP